MYSTLKMHQTSLFNALRLSQECVKSLTSGDTIAAVIPRSLEPNKAFALFSDEGNAKIRIQYWAVCIFCQILDKNTSLEIIALYTNTSLEYLQMCLNCSGSLILATLRVYQLPTAIEVSSQPIGNFIQLPNLINISDDSLPVIGDKDFEVQKQRLLKLESPESLFEKIERNLKDVADHHRLEKSKNISWIQTISILGDRSIEEDEGKSSYQAGTDFENIAKQGLEFLGFTIDEAHKGGAGGLDLFCSKPYPLTGECKAGSRVPSGTTEELIKLGGMRLGKDKFLASNKLIIGAGKVTNDVITAAREWQVSIIKAMTLQKLVELKAKYDGAINLFELKEYLQSGQIDDKINEYIQKVEHDIKLRSHVVSLVKNHHEDRISVEGLFNIYPYSDPPQPTPKIEDLRDILRDILIELSSPLAGYLGRVEENGKKCDRFYYLRDL